MAIFFIITFLKIKRVNSACPILKENAEEVSCRMLAYLHSRSQWALKMQYENLRYIPLDLLVLEGKESPKG